VKFSDDVRDPHTFQSPYRLSILSIVQKLFAISLKTEQMYKVFGPKFFGTDDPTFIRQIVSAIYCPPFGKVWFSIC